MAGVGRKAFGVGGHGPYGADCRGKHADANNEAVETHEWVEFTLCCGYLGQKA
jgi:hypothetical protein